MIVISTHAVFFDNKDVYGPPHAISIFLNKKKIDHVFIKHRLEGDGFSKIEYYKAGKLDKTIEGGFSKRVKYLQYVYEILLTIKITLQLNGCKLFVGVDSLNALAGNILKLLGKTKKTVFFSADFSTKRFNNDYLNNIYLSMDKFAMIYSDETWSVSRRITEYRKRQGLNNSKNLILPNAPFFNDIQRLNYEKIKKHDLVIVSAIKEGIAFELLIDVVFELRKKIPDIRLIIIGSGEKEKEIKNYVKERTLQKNIIFKGALTHENMFKVLVKSGVGIALYDNYKKDNFRYFSDPMKVRDYLASALPVIVSGNSAISEEVKKNKVGFEVQLEKKDIEDKIFKLMSDEELYKTIRKNAIDMAKKYDTYDLLNKYLSRIIIS